MYPVVVIRFAVSNVDVFDPAAAVLWQVPVVVSGA